MEFPTDTITAWLKAEQAAGHSCEQCGKPVAVRRVHYWRGVPKIHHRCVGKVLAAKRRKAVGKDYTAGDVCKRLGIGRSTVGRWVASGKLTPIRYEGKVLVFAKADVENLARR